MLPPNTPGFGSNGNSTATMAGNGRGRGALVPMRESSHALTTPGAPTINMRRPAPQQASFDMSALLHALRRRLPVALTLGLVLAGVAGWCAWLLVPVKSEVESWFSVKSTPPMLVENLASTEQRNANEFDYFRRTQTQMIKTPLVLIAAVRTIADLPLIKSHRDPVQFLKDELNVDFPGDSELMRISLRGEDPTQLVQIVKAVSNAYVNEVVDRDRMQKSKNYDLLLQTSETLRQQIHREQENYKRLCELLGTTSQDVVETEQKLLHEQLSISSRLMTDLGTKKLEIQTALEMLRQQQAELSETGTPDWAVTQELNRDPQFQQLNADLQQKNAELSSAMLHFKSDGPGGPPSLIRRLQDSCAELQAKVDAFIAEKSAAAAEAIAGDTSGDIVARIRGFEAQMSHLDGKIDEERGKFEASQARLKKLGASSPDLLAVMRKIEQLEFSYKKVASEVRAIEVELKAPSRVDLLQEALPPESDTSFIRIVVVGFASALVFGMTAFGLAFWELQHGRINGKADVADRLNMRVVGGLPSLGGRLRGRGANDDLVEAVDGLRTLLMHHATLHGTRVVQVTSAASREGKTTLSTQLAASLARAGRRTLFVDGDLRNPSAHLLFEMPLDPGFCDVLRGQVEVDDVVHPTRIPGLWMIPAGQCDLEAIHELAKDGVSTLFERLRLDFDFVILDSGPVLAVADSLLLGKLSDTTILSVLRDVSRASQVQEAHQSLERVGIHVLGTVVQGVKNEQETRRHKIPLQLAAN
ncbi:MAG: polysaccharide biosynthesis tyrosine autokinase [Pirellulales bacterium]|nr:polysaccharide biosynthesis tyrosine autokinase [Pirellulales bacterium]